METILTLKNISKSYGDNVILKKINIEIEKKDIYGILGLSGVGKSTLLRCINGLEKYDSGEIYYFDKKVEFTRKYKQEVAMIFQQFNLLDQKNVLNNVKIAGKIAKIKDYHQKALELLEIVGLKNKLKSYPSQLSGGQKQRVAIARALMTNPKILLCDEATSALDIENTNAILKLLKDLNTRFDLTIIIISHQMSVIENICNKVAILDNASISEKGNLYDVFLSPKTDIAKKIIYSGHLNTKFNDEKYLKLIFDGEIDTPIIANIIQDCNLLISIVFADSRTINNKIYGQMLLKMPLDKNDEEKLKKYLKLKKYKFEEVDKNEIEKESN